ncbi:YcxB family protein [Flavobacterium circumlabens]|uniref:YcxB family protein n=2 Tax=Flavobacterium circumlabens TaxID=2133765 RepID=A0A4Y7U8M0_9FLAO|nr:hypothetical protein EV142_107100 [Flavobacterium circumlabens]TEB42797.1 YcxB family protein [Flavobacterium circumlabens]
MNTSKFSAEFELNINEIQKLNKMYFKRLYKGRVRVFFILILVAFLFFDFLNLESQEDFMKWQLQSLILIVSFFMFHYSFVNATCKFFFKFMRKLVGYSSLTGRYKLNFTSSYIYVNSPLGAFAHTWSQIDKAVLTKDFFFLYVKDKDQHIISISNKSGCHRNMTDLITFVERHVMHITKM